MQRNKFDGVVESVHYRQDGTVDWVRAYLKRGPVFSDRLLIDRASLINQIKSGKKFVTGKRVEFLAGTFQVFDSVQVMQENGETYLVSGDTISDCDLLKGVPII